VGRSRRAFRRRDASSHVVVDETPAAEISVAALPPATAIFHRVARAQRCACVRLRASISQRHPRSPTVLRGLSSRPARPANPRAAAASGEPTWMPSAVLVAPFALASPAGGGLWE